MKKTLFSLLLLSFTSIGFTQDWVKLMNDPTVNFNEVKQAFNNEWNNEAYIKGKGYKQYKRWEYFMERRSFPTGERIPSTSVWNAMKNYNNGNVNRSEPISRWVALGPSSWTSSGWNPGIGRINCVTQDPVDGNILYVGSPSGGLWKSLDKGSTWSPLTDNQPVLGVSSIVIDPTDNQKIYIGTGDDDGGDNYSIGVLKSTNGGETWQETGLTYNGISNKIYKLLINPENPNHLFAATNAGLWHSTNAGDNWNILLGGVFYDIEYKPNDTTVVYACNKTVFKSVDGGFSFSPSGSGLPTGNLLNRGLISVSKDNPEYVYFLAGDNQDNSFYGLYRSENGGDSFSLRSDSPNIFAYAEDGNENGGQSWYDMALTCSPLDAEEIYIGGINVWKSTDGGITHQISSHWVHPSSIGYTHADIHVLEAFDNEIYCGSDGGIFKTTSGANAWEDLTFGMEITQFYKFGTSESNPELIIGGAQDNGTNLMNGDQWTHVIGADGMEALIDHTNPNIMYGTTQNGSLNKSTNGGDNFNGIGWSIDENGGWVTPFVMDPQNNQVLYAGYENVWKTVDSGNNWFKISDWGTSTIDDIAIAETDPNFIYTANSSILRTTYDGGQNWQEVSTGLPGLFITDIAIDPEVPFRVWVTFSGSIDNQKVFKTENGGLSWENVSYDLPNIPANCIISAKGTPHNDIYVGMDVGVFYSNDTMDYYLPFYNELPNVITSEFEINYATNKLRLATYGRGIWESNLYGTPLIEDDVVVDPTSIKEEYNGKVLVYPNPTSNEISIKGNFEKGTHVALLNNIGQLVKQQYTNASTHISVNVKELPKGLYILSIIGEKNHYVEKIIVE